jgi:hypothetical protein
MNPGETGWLKEYLEFRKELLINVAEERRLTSHPEHSLYSIIQPGGLMYGQPVGTYDMPDSDYWQKV